MNVQNMLYCGASSPGLSLSLITRKCEFLSNKYDAIKVQKSLSASKETCWRLTDKMLHGIEAIKWKKWLHTYTENIECKRQDAWLAGE